MVNKGFLNTQQLKRYKELHPQVAMNISDSFRHRFETPQILSEVMDLGTEMIVLLKLYKEQLKAEGRFPLSHREGEYENLSVIIDELEGATVNLLTEGCAVEKTFYSEEENEEEYEKEYE